MNFTEREMKYLENDNTSVDNAMIFKELKGLRADLAEVKANTGGERITRESILAIKDTKKRLQAINDNMELFANEYCSGKYTADELKGGRR